jgi:sec-independent protein translocase protein TatA
MAAGTLLSKLAARGYCGLLCDSQHLYFLLVKAISLLEERMFEGLFQPMHLLVIFGIALLVFGATKLPELGKGSGEGIRGFKSTMRIDEERGSDRTE